MPPEQNHSPRVISVFTGAAGLDIGMRRAGAQTVAMCESWEPARRVLAAHFPDIDVAPDVADFLPTTPYHVLTAGFPCTDLSHAGGKAGIFGAQSGLVKHVFRIARETDPAWIVLENVPNLLQLHRGLGIATVTSELERLGYRWAYRTLDSRFTGVPQRRNRVIVLASRDHDPAAHLLGQDSEDTDCEQGSADRAWGFYWTEGRNGLGFIRGAVPTLKGGSTIGLPSAPAVWVPDGRPGHKILLPPITVGERLQGFDTDWTAPASVDGERDMRWKLVGNAVTTGVGEWIGRRLQADVSTAFHPIGPELVADHRWPDAAFGGPGTKPRRALVSRWPERNEMTPLSSLIDDEWLPLSHRATKGFLSRIDESARTLSDDLQADLEEHLSTTRRPLPASGGTALKAPEDVVRQELTERAVVHGLDVRPESDVAHRLDAVIRVGKTAVDLRNCFWHGCPDHVDPRLAANPRWIAKRERVVKRDQEMVDTLTARGWFILVGWAHDDPRTVAAKAAELAAERAASGSMAGGALGHEIAVVAATGAPGAGDGQNPVAATVVNLDEHRHQHPGDSAAAAEETGTAIAVSEPVVASAP
jgi:DNA (cytosine-5)-methyltransferase 1